MKRRLTVLATLILFAASATAQRGSDYGVTIRAGMNLQTINGEYYGGADIEDELAVRFHVGMNFDVPLADKFHVQPGLLFTTKGSSGSNGNFQTTVSYLELPINLVFKTGAGSGNFFAGLGPYVAFGIGGRRKYEDDNVTVKQDIKFRSSVNYALELVNPYLRRLDAGGNFLIGYEFSQPFLVQFNLQAGLANIAPRVENSDAQASYKNFGVQFSLGYRF